MSLFNRWITPSLAERNIVLPPPVPRMPVQLMGSNVDALRETTSKAVANAKAKRLEIKSEIERLQNELQNTDVAIAALELAVAHLAAHDETVTSKLPLASWNPADLEKEIADA